MSMLDVGHGLAVIVRTAEHILVYDTGPVTRSGFDAGSEIVVPSTRQLSRAAPDLVVVSHGDADHAGGLASVRAAWPDAAWLVGEDSRLSGYPGCRAGQRWEWEQVTFQVLHPGDADGLSGNDGSCVIRITSAHGSALLTGDIEQAAERQLLNREIGHADVVFAPHHGSATSSTREFVAATTPAIVLVSAGFRNRWNFPRPEVVSRWRSVGASIFSTGDFGEISVTYSAHGIELKSERLERRRYWVALPGTAESSAL